MSLYHNVLVITRVSKTTFLFCVWAVILISMAFSHTMQMFLQCEQVIPQRIKASSLSKLWNTISKDTFDFDGQVSLWNYKKISMTPSTSLLMYIFKLEVLILLLILCLPLSLWQTALLHFFLQNEVLPQSSVIWPTVPAPTIIAVQMQKSLFSLSLLSLSSFLLPPSFCLSPLTRNIFPGKLIIFKYAAREVVFKKHI